MFRLTCCTLCPAHLLSCIFILPMPNTYIAMIVISLAIFGVDPNTLVWWFIVSMPLAWKGDKAFQPQTCFLRITLDIICIYIRLPHMGCNKLKISRHTSLKKPKAKDTFFFFDWLGANCNKGKHVCIYYVCMYICMYKYWSVCSVSEHKSNHLKSTTALKTGLTHCAL